MQNGRMKSLPCRISRGGFSDERVFTLASGYTGVASRQYLWRHDGHPIEEGEPPVGQTIEGLFAARVVEVLEGGRLLVSLPDGEVTETSVGDLADRPPRVEEHVPLGS